jgi:hypothetical protein
MKNNKKEKNYDSVKMMREIRDKLSKKYSKDPDKEIADLEKIRTKYRIKSKVKVS